MIFGYSKPLCHFRSSCQNGITQPEACNTRGHCVFYATTCVAGMENETPDSPARSPAGSKAMKRQQTADLPLKDAVSRQSDDLDELTYLQLLEYVSTQCTPANQVKDVTRMGVPCKCKNCDYHGFRNKWCHTSDNLKHHQYCCHSECTPEPTGGKTWIDAFNGEEINIKWYCKAGGKIFPVYTECDPKKNTLNPTSGVIPPEWDWVFWK